MSERATQVLISKIAAAQRQIDAAVRMILAGEDKLAVYTVAAAALKILRDLMRTRGKTFVADRHLYINVGLARELLKNRPSEMLDHIRKHNSSHYETVEWMADAIRKAE